MKKCLSGFVHKSVAVLAPIIAFCVGFFGASCIDNYEYTEAEDILLEQEVINIEPTDDGKIYNFLLLGEDTAAGLSDVIIIVSCDTKNSKMCVLQIPRDTYAEYTSAAYRKMNAASDILGGGRAVADFIEDNLGIAIDYYVIVTLDLISEAVDTIGGVEIDVPIDMFYSDPAQNLTINIKKGRQTLDGEQAMQFIRYRAGYLRGDLDRLDTQKIFLSALLKKIVEKRDVCTLIKLASVILPGAESDLSYQSCIEIITSVGIPKMSNISFVTLPGEDIQGSSGAWYYIMNRQAAYKIIKDNFSPMLEECEFDKNKKFTSFVRSGFNEIYEAESGFDAIIYSAEQINGGINIK